MIKHSANGSIEKYKVGFMAKGFSQKEVIDYKETFSPVSKYTSIRVVISLATQMGWQDFVAHSKKTHVCKLKRDLYKLKKAPRAWYERINKYLQGMGFMKSEADANLYYLMVGGEVLILDLYVDDLFFTDGEIFLGQGKYCIEILRRFKMEDCRAMSTPMITNWRKIDASKEKDVNPNLYRQLIGSLMYLVNTRLNISYAINSLGQFMVEPKRVHWTAAKHVVIYLRRIIKYGIRYARGDGVRLVGYNDADYMGNTVDQKITSTCYFSMGSGVVS
eukprot:PITA_01431